MAGALGGSVPVSGAVAAWRLGRARAIGLDVDFCQPLALGLGVGEGRERQPRQLVELVGERRPAIENELVQLRHPARFEYRHDVLAGKLAVVGFGEAAVDVGHRGDELVLERLFEPGEFHVAAHLADDEQVEQDVLVPVDVGFVVGPLAELDLIQRRIAAHRRDDHAGARAALINEMGKGLDRFAAALLGCVRLRQPGADAGGDDAVEHGRHERED